MESTVEASLPRCMKDPFSYRRRRTRVVMVGGVAVGGDHPIRIQSMTTTRTSDTEATVDQAVRLINAGCEIVRITAPTERDAANLKNIAAALRAKGHRTPLVADIHFRPEAALEAASHVEKVRINPGNYSDAKAFKTREYTDREYLEELARVEAKFTPLVLKLKHLGRALRIGVNHGSLSDRILNRYGDTPQGMVESALEFVRVCRASEYHDIILSMKSSNPKVMISAYRLLAARMEAEGMDYPFHLGVTEAGDGDDGRIKSAVGIGALLEDGIGDTVRVSLTEEPERELPVARALVRPFSGRTPRTYVPLPRSENDQGVPSSYVDNPFQFTRRASRAVTMGPLTMGNGFPPRAVTRWEPAEADPKRLLSLLEQRLLTGRGIPPEIVECPVRSEDDVRRLAMAMEVLRPETSRLAFLARLEDSSLARQAFSVADAVSVEFPLAPNQRSLFEFMAGGNKPLWIRARNVADIVEPASWAMAQGTALVVGLEGSDASLLLRQTRFLAALPWMKTAGPPIHITAPEGADRGESLLTASVLAGALLTDGLGDSLSISWERDVKDQLDRVGDILQGAGARVSKAEFVSCPSCGRTLFDLQTTTDRIKKRMGHLTNVKIAIMGCIVNGPGEMADADFGYVGGGPGKINLYVGKECVEKGLPAEVADERLVSLIKEHGKWKDPL